MTRPILMITRTRSGMRIHDPEMLSKQYKINMFAYSDHRKGDKWFHYVLAELKMLSWLIRNIFHSDLIYVFINDMHAFFPVLLGRLTGKKVLIHMGGYDGVWIPSLNYGAFDHPIRKWVALFNARFCHKLVPVAKCLIRGEENQYDNRKIVEGLAHFIKLPEDKYNVIYPGTEIPDLSSIERDLAQKEDSVVLVAIIRNQQNYLIKAISFYLDVAKEMPQHTFYLIGAKRDLSQKIYKKELPGNLTLIPFIPPDQIKAYYKKARVIFIPSITEGCPNVLLEGMAHGCVPVGSPRGAIPDVIGGTGKVLKKMDVNEACQAIEWAMKEGDGRLAYERIRQNFPPEERGKKLLALLEATLKENTKTRHSTAEIP